MAAAVSSAPVPFSRILDNATCIFSLCPHAGHVITTSDEGVKLAVPSKMLKRMSAAKRQTLVVKWDEKARAFFHSDCWERLEKEATSKPARAARGRKTATSAAAGAAAGADAGVATDVGGAAASTSDSSTSGPVLTPSDASLILEVCETVERFETEAAMRAKARTVAQLLKASNHNVVFTGAGVSAAAGIPTYRGTDGIDVIEAVGGTIESKDAGGGGGGAAAGGLSEGTGAGKTTAAAKEGRKRKDPVGEEEEEDGDVQQREGDKGTDKKAGGKGRAAAKRKEDPLIEASETYLSLNPTLTHRVLAKWMKENHLHYLITQNCDDLHQRAGIPRERISELHGNVFIEHCEKCRHEYRRPYCVDLFSTECSKEPWYVECETCHFNHYTGRKCTQKGCKGKLKDTIVNFGDDLFTDVLGGLEKAQDECAKARVVMCLGTSMTVTPACNLPTIMPKGGSVVIANFQDTDFDKTARVRVWGSVDALMAMVDEEMDRA